jgi:hypothetical protein
MADAVRNIGLSLGADICWPICFESLIKRLDLAIPHENETVRFKVERVTIEPFDLRQGCRYQLVLDRLTHWYHTSREWIKKAVIMDGLYVLNNPWSLQSMEKHSTYCAMMKLGLDIPDTWLVPPKAYDPTPDLQPTLERYAQLFDLGKVGGHLGYPMFMKPYDGGGWVGISRIDSEAALRVAYEQSGKRVMHLQRAVDDYDLFVRCIGVGPQVRYVAYNPDAPLHDRYLLGGPSISDSERKTLRRVAMTINSFFRWDFNSAEVLRARGTFYPIDFANACPDSQVTSLHYHFPWLVKALLRWAIFCATTRRRCAMNLNWPPYFAIAEGEGDLDTKLAQYEALADQHFETARFEEFCGTHLAHLDEVADEFFRSPEAREAVRLKVAALYPAHEVEQFTDLFFSRIQAYSAKEGPRAS